MLILQSTAKIEESGRRLSLFFNTISLHVERTKLAIIAVVLELPPYHRHSKTEIFQISICPHAEPPCLATWTYSMRNTWFVLLFNRFTQVCKLYCFISSIFLCYCFFLTSSPKTQKNRLPGLTKPLPLVKIESATPETIFHNIFFLQTMYYYVLQDITYNFWRLWQNYIC